MANPGPVTLAPGEAELLRHFAGKRRADRRAYGMGILLCGGGRTLAARTVDVSDNGILAQVTDPAFHSGDVIELALRLESVLGEDLQIVFCRGGVRLPAAFVRVAARSDLREAPLVACRFRRRPTPPELLSMYSVPEQHAQLGA